MGEEGLKSSLCEVESDHGSIGDSEVLATDIMSHILSAAKIVGLSVPALHPILDLRRLNTFVKVLLFRILTTTQILVSIENGELFTSPHLKDVYLMYPSAQTTDRFCSLLSRGRPTSSRSFHLAFLTHRECSPVVAAIVSPLQMGGLKILPYRTTG